jgi:Family of unknown function (DUF6516)
LTASRAVGIIYNMKAQVLVDDRIKQGDNAFAELLVLLVPMAVRGSAHTFKYSLSLVVEGVCVLRFDNEAGKGDHYHLSDKELPYNFSTMPVLLGDFWKNGG